jgi:hypothetical protein
VRSRLKIPGSRTPTPDCVGSLIHLIGNTIVVKELEELKELIDDPPPFLGTSGPSSVYLYFIYQKEGRIDPLRRRGLTT